MPLATREIASQTSLTNSPEGLAKEYTIPFESSRTSLPFICHGDFPANPGSPRARVSARKPTKTTTSVKPTKEPCANAQNGRPVLQVKFPGINLGNYLEVPNGDKNSSAPLDIPYYGRGYVNLQKSVSRLRGFDYVNVYKSTRTRQTLDGGLQSSLTDSKLSKHLQDSQKNASRQETTKSDVRLPGISSQSRAHIAQLPENSVNEREQIMTQQETQDPEKEINGSELAQRLKSAMDGYDDIPCIKTSRHFPGRKLGNVVAVKKLNQFLSTKKPMKMENHYNYYG